MSRRRQPISSSTGCRPLRRGLDWTHTYTRLMALCPGLPGWAGTRQVKPVWILLKQETVSGSGISWAICKSAPHSRQITTSAPHHSVFYRPDALPATQPTACEGNSKYWLQLEKNYSNALLNQQLTPYRWNILPFMLSLWLKYPKYPMKLIHYNKI